MDLSNSNESWTSYKDCQLKRKIHHIIHSLEKKKMHIQCVSTIEMIDLTLVCIGGDIGTTHLKMVMCQPCVLSTRGVQNIRLIR